MLMPTKKARPIRTAIPSLDDTRKIPTVRKTVDSEATHLTGSTSTARIEKRRLAPYVTLAPQSSPSTIPVRLNALTNSSSLNGFPGSGSSCGSEPPKDNVSALLTSPLVTVLLVASTEHSSEPSESTELEATSSGALPVEVEVEGEGLSWCVVWRERPTTICV